MLVLIEEVFQQSSGITVLFSCEYGKAKGKWMDDRPPIENSEYNVEFDTDMTVTCNDMQASRLGRFEIGMADENAVYINGMVESLEDNGCMCFRLGYGIILFSTELDAVELNSYYTIKLPEIRLYPFDI